MGRLPVIQNEADIGRDHNTYGFSMWLAGGGIKAGHVHGATDEFGHKAVTDVVNHYDYHATFLGYEPRMKVRGTPHEISPLPLTFVRGSYSTSSGTAAKSRSVSPVISTKS
jgi:hypothetical protein